MSKFIRLYMVVILVGLMSAVSFAQSTVTGAIGGTVTDPNKAVVPGATVKVVNIGTNQEASATADGEGRFRVANLQPGAYSVTVNASGFGEFKLERTVVEVGSVTNVNAQLAVGSTNVGIDVVADAPVINTEANDASTNINQTSINELPINGRRWSNFAVLTPATTPDGNFGLISFRGISGLLNNSTVDGGDNNQAFFSEERGRTRIGYSTSQSAIREFQVNTSNYSAEYGRAAGGVVNAVTKSGTNDFHGDLFYYQRNNKWGARNPLATQSVLVNGVSTIIAIKPEDVRHQFGGGVGGPIVKDKLFFFFSYDEQRRDFPGLGIFSNPNYLNTVNRTTLMAAPRNLTTAQIDSVLGFLNSLTGTVPRKGDQRIIFPKIDWQINSQNSLAVSYNRLRWKSPAGIQTQATNTRGRASFGDDFVEIDSLIARVNTVTSRVLNEFRFQYGRDNEFQNSQPPIAGEPMTAINGSAPSVFLTGGLEFGKPTFLERKAFPDEKKLQFADTMTVLAGKHSIRFGTDIVYTKDLLDNLRFESGGYSYNNINDFIIDYLNWRTPLAAGTTCTTSTRTAGRCYTSNFNQGFGPTASQLKTWDIAFFAQDDWRVSPRFTVNLGLRWEYEKFPGAQNPNASTIMIPNTNYTLNQATSNMPSDKNNFGPRIGLAYDITGDGKTSIRGGYGIYFGRAINSTISNALVNTGAPGGQAQVSIAPASGPVFPNVLTSATAGTAAIQFYGPNFALPEIHQGDIIFERQIARNTAVSVSYLFSQGRKLPTFFDRNLSPPTSTITYTVVNGPLNGRTVTIPVFTGARPGTGFAQLTEIASAVSSDYNALVLQANRRFTGGLQFQVSYTYAKSTDTNQTSTTFTANNSPFNVFDLSSERSISNFDVRQKFVASAVYSPKVKTDNKFAKALLNDWTISPIYVYYSGRPINPFTSGNAPISTTAGGINGSGGTNRFPLLPRNSFREPNLWNMDLRLSRRIAFNERFKLELLAEAFNIFNRFQATDFATTAYNVGGTAAAPTLTFRTDFLNVTGAGATLYRERQVQLSVRFQF